MKTKILFVCGAGLGSSFACQMITEEVLKKNNYEDYQLDHSDISSCISLKPNIIITAENFKTQFKNFNIPEGIKIIYLKNIVSKDEIEEKLKDILGF
ncbi:PTS sugar transporter subunit IIB [Oceanivirga salmonicida]|uniref:PTS sugar transporter subunit IIB n=1 Tax=Oceanivirga salmonicida TaxID=1769291 RepID=UPI00082E9BCC|nr:PTS sugar transporter subunit IIB [Oceanivirga salmonicida]